MRDDEASSVAGAPRLAMPALWWSIGIAGVLAVIVLSLIPDPPSLHTDPSGFGDHLTVYGTMMAWFARLDERLPTRVRIAAALALLGVVLECLQGLTGWRTFDVTDMLANASGVALGWLCAPPRLPNGLPTLESLMRRVRRRA